MLKKIILKGEQKKVLFLPPTNPIQIKGVAGSGKTTVAVYRAKHLLETHNTLFKEAKIAIFTFNETLAAYIRAVSPYINGGYQKDSNEVKPKTPDGLNVTIVSFHSWAFRFAGISLNSTAMPWEQIDILDGIRKSMTSTSSNVLNKSSEFFQEEISWIKGKLFTSKSEYIEAKRSGRGTSDRVTASDKEVIWSVLLKYNQELKNRGKVDFDDYALLSLKKIESEPNWKPPFTHIIIDEAQDLNKAQILVISKLVSQETKSISIITDAAQRIFKSGFTWSEVGLNVIGGRTISLKKNYRNTIQIAEVAKSLLDNEVDKDDFTEIEFSNRPGKKPKIACCESFDEQLEVLKEELNKLIETKSIFSTVILHRTLAGVTNIKKLLDSNGYETEIIKTNDVIDYKNSCIKICTMPSIKGLEFQNVFIIDLNDNIIPYPDGFIDEQDYFHISTERRLLYTCMTRAESELFLLTSDRTNASRYLKEINPDLLEDITPNNWFDGTYFGECSFPF